MHSALKPQPSSLVDAARAIYDRFAPKPRRKHLPRTSSTPAPALPAASPQSPASPQPSPASAPSQPLPLARGLPVGTLESVAEGSRGEDLDDEDDAHYGSDFADSPARPPRDAIDAASPDEYADDDFAATHG
jgi:hypothetical protein